MIARLDELLGREIVYWSLDILRPLTGPIVVLHLWPFVDDAIAGHQYRDTFYEPYASWYPELPRSLYAGVLVIGAVAGLAMVLRRVARPATIVAFAVVAYNVFLSTTHFHNNRALLLIVLGVLAMTPVRETGPAWPLWLLRAEVVVVYAASGLSKLFDPDWFGGVVTRGRVRNVEDRLVAETPLPDGPSTCSPIARSMWSRRRSWCSPSCSSPSAFSGAGPVPSPWRWRWCSTC